MGTEHRGVLVPTTFRWDASFAEGERRLVLDRILRLPGWARGDSSAANLDIKPLRGHGGLYRLRSGRLRAIFQRLGEAIIIHRVDRRGDAYEDHDLDAIRLVRSGDGLRALEPARRTEPATARTATPTKDRHLPRARPATLTNPLSIFTDAELRQAGLTVAAIDAARRIPAGVAPDDSEALAAQAPAIRQRVVELWERPKLLLDALQHQQPDEMPALLNLSEEEARRRLSAEDSLTGFVEITSAASFEAILDQPIERWMLYLHASQRRPVEWSATGPARIRGAAGTGKTVVALHRARALAERRQGTVLLTTFVSTLPKVWRGLFAFWAPQIADVLQIRTLDQIALELHHAAGGAGQPADEDWLLNVVQDLHGHDDARYGGLSAFALYEELEHVVAGRRLDDADSYYALPRTGRGTPLRRAAREQVWLAYEAYVDRQDAEQRYSFSTLRRSALDALQDGAVRRRYAAVVVDEAQDLTEVGARLVAQLAGGGDRPDVTFVGDGQQSIYPGGFTMGSLGLDVRGRSAVLRRNWRNAYPVWVAAKALLEGEAFEDLDDEPAPRSPDDEPLPVRDGPTPLLHVYDGSTPEAAEWLAAVVKNDLAAGIDPGDCAVLAPSRGPLRALERALTSAAVSFQRLERYEGQHADAVWLGTFHRAKGLEFKRVFVFGLDAQTWPPRLPGLSDDAQAAIRARWLRAAFVAMTRARDWLEVVVPGEPAVELQRAAWAFDQ